MLKAMLQQAKQDRQAMQARRLMMQVAEAMPGRLVF
jgi:hypothetical protein